jgi:alpha-L-fucosidase 2
MIPSGLVVIASCLLGVEAKQLWAKQPADPANIIMSAYPIGNGKLGGEFITQFLPLLNQ